MGERDSARLGTLQLAVMRVLWERGEASVSDVHAELAAERRIAPTTVATLLKRLERRGYVGHRARGRRFLYRPLRDEEEVHRAMVSELTDELFDGDASELVVHLLRAGDIAPGDLAHIRRLIEERERGGGPADAG